jgi:predicted nucleotidyltransferase
MNVPSGTGLKDTDITLIANAARRIPEIRQVVLFGSRAKGTHKPGSDVDLALRGDNLDYESAIRMAGILNEETPMPYFFDVVNYETVTEACLK